jgi:hypothetical protein
LRGAYASSTTRTRWLVGLVVSHPDNPKRSTAERNRVACLPVLRVPSLLERHRPVADRLMPGVLARVATESKSPYGANTDNAPVERLVVTLRLREGTREWAAELIAAGPPFDPADLGVTRHAVYLGRDLVIFAFEGDDVEQRVSAIINDPVSSASFGAWMPLLADSPALAQEAYYWEAAG